MFVVLEQDSNLIFALIVEPIKQWNSDITVQETKFNDENSNIEVMK